MITDTVQSALRRLGSRAALGDTCPMCGRAVTPTHDRVRAWRGKYAHRGCAHYTPSNRR